jgi:3-oxoacyl-[acyl-carrier-protein] synthase II
MRPEAAGTAEVSRPRATVAAIATGWSIHLPGLDASAVLGLDAAGVACDADEAHRLLGRKGLLFKEPATRLALCAVHRALGLAPGASSQHGPVDPRTAVVVGSNLGNVETVADLVRIVRTDGGRAVSPLAAPNASSNVLASTVASWFGWGGPNLMVCSGATAGLDAVALAILLLAAGRADRVVVVGSEPADETATALHAHRAGGPAPLRAGAACVVLESPDSPVNGPRLGPVRVSDQRVTATTGTSRVERVLAGGDSYGADGIIRLAGAVAILDAGFDCGPVRIVSGDAADGWRSLDVTCHRGGVQ